VIAREVKRVSATPEREPEPEPPAFKRIRIPDEANLLGMLAQQAQEVDLDSRPRATRAPGAAERGATRQQTALLTTQNVRDLIAARADLKGLPVLGEKECQTSREAALALREASSLVRGLAQTGKRGTKVEDSFSRSMHPDFELLQTLTSSRELRREAALPALTQILQTRSVWVRLRLVEMLARVNGETSTAALAQRALFDLAPEVREAAVKALRDQPRQTVRRLLLAGLRYPWAPVAEHAAEAVVALDDQEAVPALVGLLDEPDPTEPVRGPDRKWHVKELVKMNHLSNCMLCHAPSTGSGDPVRGLVPERGKELPVVYYESQRGNFVRADVVYLRQDFSLVQPVANAHPWPNQQRFDYLTRTRELSPEEVDHLALKQEEPAGEPYPQKRAVLWALRELTGLDAGENGAHWYRALEGRYPARER
jgi:hypothetical protein